MHETTLTINVLTGSRYWDQTVACLESLFRQVDATWPVRILDDGSLTSEQAAILKRLGPEVEVQSEAEAKQRLHRTLPATQFPELHRLWHQYKHIRKLTDAHVGRKGYQLVLDSDMLFHRTPEELLHLMRRPDRPVAMRDCVESYGYSRDLMQSMIKQPLLPEVNVGIVGADSAQIDWRQIEKWLADLIQKGGQSYFLEQAIMALLLSQQATTILDAHAYRVLAQPDANAERTACLVHYVAQAKHQYFCRDWRGLEA